MRPRVIALIMICDGGVYNTTKFKKFRYIGDPINTAKLYNDKEVDELVIVDSSHGKKNTEIDFTLLDKIRSQCFFPVSYGGGIRSLEDADRIFNLGIEKVVLNTVLSEGTDVYQKIIEKYGSQSVCISLDVKKSPFGKHRVFSHAQNRCISNEPLSWLKTFVDVHPPGEVLLTSVDRDGTGTGYDLSLLNKVVNAFEKVPIVINGGASKLEDFSSAIKHGAHAMAATSLFVYKRGGILINYPEQALLEEVLNE